MNFYLYARKSTDDEERQMLSIEAQLDELREYAGKEGLTVAREFVESRTAKEPGRPIFNAMLAEVEKGKATGLLAWNPDRLARNSVDGGRIIYLVDTGKLTALKFPTFWFENTPQGKFVLNMAFGQSKYYVDALSENVRRGMRQKLRRGEFPGKPPVGYMNEPRLRTIIVDEHKAQLVRRMFETYATGRYTFDELHELVTGWGLTSHREKPIARSMLPRLLANPFYVGLFRFADEAHEGTHQPLVTQALFEEVQNVMARRGRPHKPRPGPLPYVGAIQCGACGAAITGERQKGHHYYHCTRKLGPCSQKRFIREETLTDEFRRKTVISSIPRDGAQPMLAQFAEWRRAETDSRSAQLTDAKERLAAIESRLSRLLDVYIDGTVDHDDYARKKEELLHDKAAIKEGIGRIQSDGNAWLEPMADFLKDAIQAETIALTGTPEELVGFHRRIGSNLSLIEPEHPEDGTDPETRASKERAAKSAARHGGFAARDSFGPASLPPSSRMKKAGAWSGEKSADVSEVASPAVTSDAAETSAASVVSLARVAESRHPTDFAPHGRRSSSRWAERPVPVLRVVFPEPWSIIAAANLAAAPGDEIAGNLKWSGRRDLNPRLSAPKADALPDCATPRRALDQSHCAWPAAKNNPGPRVCQEKTSENSEVSIFSGGVDGT